MIDVPHLHRLSVAKSQGLGVFGTRGPLRSLEVSRVGFWNLLEVHLLPSWYDPSPAASSIRGTQLEAMKSKWM